MTEKDLEIVEKYKSLSKEEREAYLENNLCILLDIGERGEDGKHPWTFEISNKLMNMINTVREKDETDEETLSRMIHEGLKLAIEREKNAR